MSEWKKPLVRMPFVCSNGFPMNDRMPEKAEQWREDEREIDGGYCGCEYPRLWPPRRNTVKRDDDDE